MKHPPPKKNNPLVGGWDHLRVAEYWHHPDGWNWLDWSSHGRIPLSPWRPWHPWPWFVAEGTRGDVPFWSPRLWRRAPWGCGRTRCRGSAPAGATEGDDKESRWGKTKREKTSGMTVEDIKSTIFMNIPQFRDIHGYQWYINLQFHQNHQAPWTWKGWSGWSRDTTVLPRRHIVGRTEEFDSHGQGFWHIQVDGHCTICSKMSENCAVYVLNRSLGRYLKEMCLKDLKDIPKPSWWRSVAARTACWTCSMQRSGAEQGASWADSLQVPNDLLATPVSSIIQSRCLDACRWWQCESRPAREYKDIHTLETINQLISKYINKNHAQYYYRLLI